MNRLPSRLRSLRPRDLHDLLIAGWMLSLIEVGLRTAPVDRLARCLGVATDSRTAGPASAATGPLRLDSRRLKVAGAMLRYGPFPDTCLRRALLAGWLLRRHSPVLRIGVAKVDGTVKAHAWLQVDGVNLDPIGSARFEALDLRSPVVRP